MPEERFEVVTFAAVSSVRPCRLLRRFAEFDTLPSISTRPATPSLKATIRRKVGAGVMSMRYSSICPAAPRLRLVQFHATIDAGRTNDESRGPINDARHI